MAGYFGAMSFSDSTHSIVRTSQTYDLTGLRRAAAGGPPASLGLVRTDRESGRATRACQTGVRRGYIPPGEGTGSVDPAARPRDRRRVWLGGDDAYEPFERARNYRTRPTRTVGNQFKRGSRRGLSPFWVTKGPRSLFPSDTKGRPGSPGPFQYLSIKKHIRPTHERL